MTDVHTTDLAALARDAGWRREVSETILGGQRLSRDQGEALYATDDLAWLGGLARERQRALSGEAVLFNVNRHLNLTNVCAASCSYCSFERKPGAEDAYTMRFAEAVAKAKEMEGEGLTELHVVNGLHPVLPYEYYPTSIRKLKEALPDVAIKAFTATEIDWFTKLTGKDAEWVLDDLVAAGLASLTGGGAEIFDPEIRDQIVDHDCHWERWSEIHALAHAKGLKTPCTMLYGHIEAPRHRVDHVLRLRELQDSTGGFVTFIPLRFHPENSRLSHLPLATGAEAMKVFAVSRLLFDNVPHLKCFWVMHGLDLAQLLLEFGVDDLDGSVVEYKITHDPTGRTPDTMHREDLLKLIRDAGRTPVERDTRYNVVRTYD
ncbi:MAG TPA: aminofutalosine synthase MqnE [Egibacteraceae bacterium]|nr:aminofutalosine synthase MqnE [Egibacteraceae bacterium]